jgi:catechol 2,3-dioxygenase-like lactoylglutathione lyase family enzyme
MAIHGISHLGLTVSNLSASQAWYSDVLGWQSDMNGATETTRFSSGRLPDGTPLVLREHDAGVDARFDERRPGLDHLSLACENAADLDVIVDRIQAAGTAWTPIQRLSWGDLLNFRDPDNIAVECIAPPST